MTSDDLPPLAHAPMPGAEHLIEPLRSRWSPSVYDDQHRLSAADITTLLHAAQWAPSSGNSQPWRLIVCERGDAAHQALVPTLSRGNSGWVPRASVVFLTAEQTSADPERPEAYFEPLTAGYVVGQAAAHLTIQAHGMGLWAHQFSGFDQAAAGAALACPAHFRIVAGIAVGVRGNPADVSERDRNREHKERSRRPLPEIAYGERWAEPWSGLTR